MQSAQVARMSAALKALSDSNRIRILEILVSGEYCVSDLVARLQIDQPKVSHHLAILRSAGVIRSRRDGRHINYSIRPAVHRVEGTPEAPMHVFDLTDLCVTFRFPDLARATDPRPAESQGTRPGAAEASQAAEAEGGAGFTRSPGAPSRPSQQPAQPGKAPGQREATGEA